MNTWWLTAAPIAAGVMPVVVALLATGLVPLKGVALIPVTGILIGGALTVTVLAGRRALDAAGCVSQSGQRARPRTRPVRTTLPAVWPASVWS